MTRAAFRALAAGPALFFVSGCCCFIPAEAETLVVVVPSRHDGHVGAVVVTRGERRQLLDTAYVAARSGPTGEIVRTALQPREVEELRTTFAEASEALPTRVLTYRLYFEFGSETLTEDSKRTLDAVLGDIASRSAAEILVVGHSDNPGTPEANDALSLRRAELMRELIVARGVPPDAISAIGVGARQPEVETLGDVEEARNRRVEITVR
jgi:outer membrane protein OmpA-like peptidoglycan-associated protein